MNRADKIDSIISILRNEPQPEDITFTITGYLLQEDGNTLETGDLVVITWPSDRTKRIVR